MGGLKNSMYTDGKNIWQVTEIKVTKIGNPKNHYKSDDTC
jgi:hypothetical protein